jgi:hypothetical protein
VRQRLPGGEAVDAARVQERGHVGGQRLGVGGGGGDRHHQPPAPAGQPGEHQGPGHVGDHHLCPGGRAAVPLELLEQAGEGRVVRQAVQQRLKTHLASDLNVSRVSAHALGPPGLKDRGVVTLFFVSG